VYVLYLGYGTRGRVPELRGDSLFVLLFKGRVFSIRAHRVYGQSLSREALVVEQDPRNPLAAIEHREGPAFKAMFPCADPGV
jgi:hypothetical protein